MCKDFDDCFSLRCKALLGDVSMLFDDFLKAKESHI